MKLRLLLALPALLLACLLSHAQAYEPGLLVRSTGDTLRGEIENGFWVEPPEFIRFRATPDSPGQLFQPRQLRAVSFTNGRYFRYEALPINHAAEVQLDRLTRGYSRDVRTDSLLAEVLLEGPAELLRVVPDGITHYLIRRAGQPYLELCEQRYLRETSNGAFSIANANNYRSQLEIYFGDCATASDAAEKALYTAAGIAAVIGAYSTGCAPTPRPGRSWLTLAKERRRVAIQGGILLGTRYNHIASPSGLNGSELLDKRLRPTGGLFAEMFLPGRTTSIYGELNVCSVRGRTDIYSYSSGIFIGGFQSYEYSYGNYSGWLGSAHIGVRHYSPLGHGDQLVIGGSYELDRVFSPTFSTITTFSSSHPTETQPAPAGYTSRVGFTAQTLLPALTIGWRTQRLTLTLDGQRCYDYRDKTNDVGKILVGSAWSARLIATYRLGHNHDTPRPAAAPK